MFIDYYYIFNDKKIKITQMKQQKVAKKFINEWMGRNYEKQEVQKYWIQLLGGILEISIILSYIEFEKRVQLFHTSYIGVYISNTKILIEQKK